MHDVLYTNLVLTALADMKSKAFHVASWLILVRKISRYFKSNQLCWLLLYSLLHPLRATLKGCRREYSNQHNWLLLQDVEENIDSNPTNWFAAKWQWDLYHLQPEGNNSTTKVSRLPINQWKLQNFPPQTICNIQ